MLALKHEMSGSAFLQIPQLTDAQKATIGRRKSLKDISRDGNVLYLEGLAFYHGLDRKSDVSKAVNRFLEAANSNVDDADYSLGVIFYLGDGVEQDFERAAFHWERAAKAGHLYSCNNFALLHSEDLLKKSDPRIALENFTLVANTGSAVGKFNLGMLYHRGCGVEINHKKAARLYLDGVIEELPEACVSLGIIYLNGLDVKPDLGEARRLFELAAHNSGSPHAWNMLGIVNFKSEYGQRDIPKAIECFTNAVDQGLTEAIYNLGHAFSAAKRYSDAVIYLERAAKLENVHAQSELAQIYAHGLSGRQDWVSSRNYAELAAAQNDPMANYLLGLMYAHGYDVQPSVPRALEYWERAGKLGSGPALNNLGVLHLSGRLGKQNIVEAMFFYSLASERGEEEARKNLQDLEKIQQNQIVDNPQLLVAAQALEKLVDDKNATPDQKEALSRLYLSGFVLKYDFYRGFELAKSAATKGNVDAQKTLLILERLIEYVETTEKEIAYKQTGEDQFEISGQNVINLFPVNNKQELELQTNPPMTNGDEPPLKLNRVYRRAKEYPNPDKRAQSDENRTTDRIAITISPQLLADVEHAAQSRGLDRGEWFKYIFERWLATNADVEPADFPDYKKTSRIEIYLPPHQMAAVRQAATATNLKPAKWIQRVSNLAANLPSQFPDYQMN